jgi:uncharacterized protein YgfB (UPF0149 family)
MIQDVVDALVAHGQTVLTATRGKTLAGGVRQFIETLGLFPDNPAAELSAESFEMVTNLAEQIIAHIERRIETEDDKSNQELAESVYDIRRNVEEIYRWRKHYLGS